VSPTRHPQRKNIVLYATYGYIRARADGRWCVFRPDSGGTLRPEPLHMPLHLAKRSSRKMHSSKLAFLFSRRSNSACSTAAVQAAEGDATNVREALLSRQHRDVEAIFRHIDSTKREHSHLYAPPLLTRARARQLFGFGRNDGSSKLIRGLRSKTAAGFRSRRGLCHERPPSPLTMLLSPHRRRREFIAGLEAAVARLLAPRAQQPGVPVIGFLDTDSREATERIMSCQSARAGGDRRTAESTNSGARDHSSGTSQRLRLRESVCDLDRAPGGRSRRQLPFRLLSTIAAKL
jgi:hypothetical protein